MPNVNIQNELKALNVDEKVKKNINALESFIKENISTKLNDLLAPTFELTKQFSEIKTRLESLNISATIANGIFNKDSEQLLSDIKTIIKEIRDDYPSLKKENSIGKLDAAKNTLEKEIKKPLDERNESVISKAENELKKQTILVLKEQLKKDNKNFKAAIKLYNLTSEYPLCVARYLWLKDQCTQNSNYAEAIENLIKEKINAQARADITGSSHSVSSDITLLDLARIKDWTNFKLNFGKQLKEFRSKQNEAAALVNKTSETLNEENLILRKEVDELKLKITSLEEKLSITHSNLEERKALPNESADSSNQELNPLKDQNDEIIILNNQLLAENEKNKTLSKEIDAHEHKNNELEKAISNLKNELEKYKSELEVKEKQIAENSTKLKHHELQLNQKEQELIQNKSDLEKSSREIKKLSEDLANKSKNLEKTNKELSQIETKLNELNSEKHQIELQLHDALQEKKYNAGLFAQNEEELLKLTEQRNQLKAQIKQDKDNFTSNSYTNNHKISLLESDIDEKELFLEKLKNELDDSKKTVTKYKHQINDLKTDLELKEQELNYIRSQLQTLTKQSEDLSVQKNILEQKYETELAESLVKYKALQAQFSATTLNLEEKLNKLQEKNISSEEENRELKENLESYKMRLKKENDALSAAKKEILELTTTLFTAQSNLTSVNKNFHAQLEATKVNTENFVKKYDLFISKVDEILYHTDNQVSSFIKLDNLSEEQNQILKKLHTFKKQVDQNQTLEDKVFELQLSQSTSENENTKLLTKEKEALQNQIQELLEKIDSLKEQNQNLIQDLNRGPIQIEEDVEDGYDETGFQFDTVSMDSNLDDDDEIKKYKSFSKTFEELTETQNKLKKVQEDLLELQTYLKEKEIEIENLTTKNLEDTNDLVTRLSEAEERLKKFQDQMTVLKAEQAEELMKKDVSSEQILASQKTKLDELKAKHEQSILELKNQITDKEANLEALSLKLTTADQQAQVHKKTINSLEAEKLILKNQIGELEQKNTDLQQKLDLASATKDTRLTELQQEKISNEEELQQLRNQLEDLEKNLENKQTTDSDLKKEYANLKDQFAEKNQELNLIKNTLETSNAELKIANEEIKSLKAKLTDASQIIQEKLSSLKEKEGPMKDVEVTPQFNKPFDQDKFDPFFVNPADFKTDPINRSDSSSGHGSRNSLSPDLIEDEDLIDFLSDQVKIPKQPSTSDEVFSDGSSSDQQPRTQSEPNLHFSDEESLDSSEEEKLSNTNSRPSTPNTNPFTTSEHQGREATLEEIKQGVSAAFQPQNKSAIVEAFTKEFFRIASHAAKTFFNAEIDSNELPDFKDKLQEISKNQIIGLVNALFEDESLQVSIRENIHIKGLSQSTYLDEVKNSAALIFDNLTIKQPNKTNQKYKDYIIGKANDLLVKLCIDNLRTNEREQLIELAKNNLEEQAADNNLQVTEYTEIIQHSAEELLTKLLKTSNLQNTLEEIAKHPIVGFNLLDASRRKLQDQVKQQINENFDHYFPNLQLDPILEKINSDKVLSDEEIAKFPSELQYADTIEEFVSGLRVKYPNLPSNFENQINGDAFKQLRLTLRKNALSAISQTTLPDDISDLNAKAWLENQLQLITGKSVHLEQIQLEKNQINLLNELDSALQLSTFYDISLTPKSITELKAELKKFNQAQLAAVAEKNKLFSEIQSEQIHYPSLMPDENAIKGFRGNINQYLDNLSLEWQINDQEATILLTGINQRLKKDLSKWDLLGSQLYTEITDTILNIADENSFKFGNDVNEKRKIIEEIVKHGLTILRENYPNDTFQKRESWLKNTTLLYAATQKLQKFSSGIANRKTKIENLLGLKDNKDHEVRTATGNASATYEGIFLPHNCIVIADSYDPNLEKPINSEFTMLTDSFYSKDAMRTGQTIIFEQKLNNGKNREWSVTKDATSLSYDTGSSWVDRLKNVGGRIRNKIDPFNSTQLSAEDKEVVFAAFSHAIASSKGSVLTLSIGANCSKEKETYIRFLIEDFNRNPKISVSGQPIKILINDNVKLKVHKKTKTVIQEEIKTKTSPTKELDNVASQSNKITQNIRSRGL